MPGMTPTVAVELDLSGHTCPMPLLKTKQALNKLASGAVVQVIATDPASMRDFKVFAEQSGNVLLQASEEGGSYRYLIQKK